MSATAAAVYSTGDQTNYPRTVENDDGSLSAPIMYASVVMGIITMWPEKRNDAKQASDSEGSGDEPLSAGSKAPTKDRTAWDEQVYMRGQEPGEERTVYWYVIVYNDFVEICCC